MNLTQKSKRFKDLMNAINHMILMVNTSTSKFYDDPLAHSMISAYIKEAINIWEVQGVRYEFKN